MTRSATSNETLSGGDDVSVALKNYFPSLTKTDIQEISALYPLSDYDSPSQRFQVATGRDMWRESSCRVTRVGSLI